jgi:manganese/zinc/iron transport system permease protein
VLLVRNLTRLKEDTALGIVLSVFFGGGVAVLGIAQRTGQGHSAGLESFIYGKTASMVEGDAILIAAAAVCVILVCILLFKEFRMLCFDAAYAASQGWRTTLLDIAMMTLVVVVTVVGLQAVGLILIIALLIIPAAAARFWTERLSTMMWIAAIAGGVSGLIGAMASAVLPNLPSGAMIVIVAGLVFLFSMIFGRGRGVLIRSQRRAALNRRVRRQHLLRAMYEAIEPEPVTVDQLEESSERATPFGRLLSARSWTAGQLRRELGRAEGDGLVEVDGNHVRFTPEGFVLARRVVRNHRLWEMFLITHADIAATHVDRDADAIEHVLGAELVRKLEAMLVENQLALAGQSALASPHVVDPAARLAVKHGRRSKL